MTFPMHRLLELQDPSAQVAVCGPVEPALISYYLELIGIGAGNRILAADMEPPAPAVVTLSDLRAARVPLADDGAEPAATVRVRVRPDHSVQVLSAHDRLPDGGTRLTSGSASYVDELYRYGARTGAQVAGNGFTGAFAVDFALGEAGAAALGPSDRPEEHAHATLFALRANAFRTGAAYFDGDWRDAVAALRATGAAWNPIARAGVVLYGLETLADTGELSLVALGNARTEAEQCFYAALTALEAVQAATTVGLAA